MAQPGSADANSSNADSASSSIGSVNFDSTLTATLASEGRRESLRLSGIFDLRDLQRAHGGMSSNAGNDEGKTRNPLKDAILHSILFVASSFPFDRNNPSLLFLLSEWGRVFNLDTDLLAEEVKDALLPEPSDFVNHLLNFLTDFRTVPLDLLESLIEPCAGPPTDVDDPSAFLASLLFTQHVSKYLITGFRPGCSFDANLEQKVAQFSADIIRSVINMVQEVDQNEDENTRIMLLLNLLFMVKILLPKVRTSSPALTSDNVLENFSRGTLRNLYGLEPNPIGACARDLLQDISWELDVPGYLSRFKLERVLNKTLDKKNTFYIIVNRAAKHSERFLEKIGVSLPDGAGSSNAWEEIFLEKQSEQHIEINHVKANLLLNIFEDSEGCIPPELLEFSEDFVAGFYTEGKDILDKTMHIQSEEERNTIRTVELEKLSGRMIKQNFRSMESSFGKSRKTSRRLVRDPNPALPNPDLSLICVPFESEEQLTNSETKIAKIFPVGVWYKVIEGIVNKEKTKRPDEPFLRLDIGIAGGSGTLQHFVTGLTVLATKQKILKDVDLRFYLLPTGEENVLAGFLEKFDGWYSRNVYTPVLGRVPILPFIKASNKAGPILDDYFTPSRYLRDIITNYFAEATNNYKVHIFRCECLQFEFQTAQDKPPENEKVSQKEKDPPKQQRSTKVRHYVMLPFIQQVDVGVRPAFLAAKKKNPDLFSHQTLTEMIRAKTINFRGTHLQISHLPCDTTGKPTTKEVTEETQLYASISIKSVSGFGSNPRVSDGNKKTLTSLAPIAAPHDNWLEVSISKFDTEKRRRRLFREQDLPECLHVGSIKIENNDPDGFHIVLDGELYGPFHKVIVQPYTDTVTKELVTFNVQTFVPLDYRT